MTIVETFKRSAQPRAPPDPHDRPKPEYPSTIPPTPGWQRRRIAIPGAKAVPASPSDSKDIDTAID